MANNVANCGGLRLSDTFEVENGTKNLKITNNGIVEDMLSESISEKLNNTYAVDVQVEDEGGYYDGENSEAIFAEVGDKLTTLFNDLPPAPFVIAKVGVTAPTLSTFNGNIKQYTFGVNDEIYGTSEVTHLYIAGTDLMPHIHWTTNGTDTTDRYVKWELEYSWANRNETNGVFSAPITITQESIIPANTGSLMHYSTQLPLIDGTNIHIGAYLCWRIRRVSSTGTAPTNNPFGLAFGIHVYESVLQ